MSIILSLIRPQDAAFSSMDAPWEKIVNAIAKGASAALQLGLV